MRSRLVSRGFTLTEVLVVTVILAILAGLVVTQTAPAREKARQSSCAAQLRQLHQAVLLYSGDSDTGEEVAGLSGISMAPPLTGYKVLDPYLKTREVFFCPDLAKPASKKVTSSYVWWPVNNLLMGNSNAESAVLADQARKIENLGSKFPLFVCQVHDEVFYQPRERDIDITFAKPYVVEVTVGGSVLVGRRDYTRTHHIQSWMSLPRNAG